MLTLRVVLTSVIVLSNLLSIVFLICILSFILFLEIVLAIEKKQLPVKHIPGPEGVRGRNSDNTLVKQVLGWSPRINLRVRVCECMRASVCMFVCSRNSDNASAWLARE